MGFYKLGDVIKYTRKSMNLTQEKLSEGICTTESLSRFETGKLTPTNQTFFALMEKMDKEAKRYILPVSMGVLAIENMIRDITFYKEKMEYKKVKKLIKK